MFGHARFFSAHVLKGRTLHSFSLPRSPLQFNGQFKARTLTLPSQTQNTRDVKRVFHGIPYTFTRTFTSSNNNSNSNEGKTNSNWSKESREKEQKEKNKSVAVTALAVVVGILGLAYAAAPLYTLFCQVTGFAGTTKTNKGVGGLLPNQLDTSRPLHIHFTSDISGGMPWTFAPAQKTVRVVPGETSLIFYLAENHSKEAITGVATYNVTPQKAGAYFNKVQCFCFDEQKLQPGEEVYMPVLFFIDPKFANDPKMKNVDDITLSYTFFRTEDT